MNAQTVPVLLTWALSAICRAARESAPQNTSIVHHMPKATSMLRPNVEPARRKGKPREQPSSDSPSLWIAGNRARAKVQLTGALSGSATEERWRRALSRTVTDLFYKPRWLEFAHLEGGPQPSVERARPNRSLSPAPASAPPA